MKIKDIEQIPQLLERANILNIMSTLPLRATLSSSENKKAVIKPPTHRGEKDGGKEKSEYPISKQPDGNLMVDLDQEASQANRIEPEFKSPRYRSLVPEVKVVKGDEVVDLLDITHRVADASVRNSDASEEITKMLLKADKGDIVDLARLAPTSILFGNWDSRGTKVKMRRLFRALIRAFGITELSAGVTVSPKFRYDDLIDLIDKHEDKPKGKGEKDIGEAMQKIGMKMFSSSVGILGGVMVDENSVIERVSTISVNRIRAWVEEARYTKNTDLERAARYIFGLGIVAYTMPPELDLREGCTLYPDGSVISAINVNDGPEEGLEIDHETAIKFCQRAADDLGISGPRTITFDPKKGAQNVINVLTKTGKDTD